MPDWKQELAKRLEHLEIDPGREAAIIEELSQHLDDRYEELLLGGSSESEARRTVLEELERSDIPASALPSTVSNSARRAPLTPAALPSGNLFADFTRDLKFGVRSLINVPAFSFFAILTLALGIGATTTVFTVVNTLLLHPLPAPDPSRLACLYTTDLKNQRTSSDVLPISYLNLKDY